MKFGLGLGVLLLIALLAVPLTVFAATSGPSPIPPPPNFQISTNVLSLCKGTINTVPVVISTPPGAEEMQQVQLSLTNTREAYSVGNGTVSAANVSANVPQTVLMHIFLSLNSTPLVSVGIGINYEYSTLYTDSEVRNISFGTETCTTPLAISVHPSVFVSGKIENITLNLANNGTQTLNLISVRAALPQQDGTFLGAQPVQVGSISPKGKVQINESVFVYRNATQSFPVNLNVSFYNGTSLQQAVYNPIVLSTGIINITPSSITLSPTNPTPGGVFSISFILTDIGTSTASAVTATPLTKSGFSSYGSNSVFVGDMQVDTQTPVTLTLTTNSAVKAGTYTIPVRINYLDGLRENLSTIIYVPVTVASASGTFGANGLTSNGIAVHYSRGSGSGLVLIIILVVVIILFVWLYLRERKSHGKLREEHTRLKAMGANKTTTTTDGRK